MKTRPTRIQLKGEGVHEEGRAASTIKPGMLIKMNSAGNLIPHGTAGGVAEKSFALEDALQGRGIDDNYASGELVSYALQSPGDVVFAFLSAGEHATPDEFLTSNGDGTLKVAGGSDNRIAAALEEMDLSDTSDVDTRMRVRIL